MFRSSVVFTPEVHVELIQFVSALEVIPFQFRCSFVLVYEKSGSVSVVF